MQSKVLAMAVAVGLGASSFSAVAATSDSTTKHHQRHHKTVAATAPTTHALAYDPAAEMAQRDQEIAELKQSLASVQERLGEIEQRTDAQSDINVATQQNVEKLQDDGKKVDKVVKQVNDNTVTGKAYIDISGVNQTNHGVKTNASGIGLDVKRFYFSVNHQFNDIWSANLTTDFNYVSNDSETQLFVKKAYLQGKFSDAMVFRAGSADMPWIPYVENYYGYRYVENTLIDRLKFGNSADWGLNLGGKVGGGFDYSVSAVNGGGYKNPSRTDRMDFEGRIGFQPMQDTVIAVGAYSGTLGKQTKSVNALHTADRIDVLAAYAKGSNRFGIEYFQANNWTTVLNPLSDKAVGYSIWGSLGLGDSMAVFARYDRAKPSKDLNPSLTDQYYNIGLELPIYKGVKWSTVYKHERLKDHGATDTKTDEFGVWGEVAF